MSMLSREIRGYLSSASWIRKMFEQADELRARLGPTNVFDFSLGNPHLEPPAEIVARLRDLTTNPLPGMHRYMVNAGFPAVRTKVAAALSRRLRRPVPFENVVMTAGAACGLNVALRALLDPGEGVIVFAPYFPEYQFYIANAGGRMQIVETTADFNLNPEALERAIDERTRAVIVNSPNNPTGRVYPAATIRDILQVIGQANRSRARPLVLISDEPYRRLVYDDAVIPELSEYYPHTLTVASFSKELGLAGERIGYIVVHPDCHEAGALIGGIIFCVRTLGFVNAPALMQLTVADCLEAVVDVESYRYNRDLLCDGLIAAGYEVRKPEGAFFLFPRSPMADDAAFVQLLVEHAVLAVPGRGFGRAGYFRLSYAVEPEIIRRALPAFQSAYRKSVQALEPRRRRE